MSTTHPAKKFVEVTDPHGVEFAQLFEIYGEALPAGERKPQAVIKELVARPDYRVIAVKDEEQVLAFLVVFVSMHEDVALLEHLATASHLRGQGLGAAMFAKAVEIAETRPLLVEFDADRDDCEDHEMRTRRKNFYLRQGCRQIENLDYLMPQVSDSKPPVMDLAYYWAECSTPPGSGLVRHWLQTIYTEVYQRSRDDPAIEAMMAGLGK